MLEYPWLHQVHTVTLNDVSAIIRAVVNLLDVLFDKILVQSLQKELSIKLLLLNDIQVIYFAVFII